MLLVRCWARDRMTHIGLIALIIVQRRFRVPKRRAENVGGGVAAHDAVESCRGALACQADSFVDVPALCLACSGENRPDGRNFILPLVVSRCLWHPCGRRGMLGGVGAIALLMRHRCAAIRQILLGLARLSVVGVVIGSLGLPVAVAVLRLAAKRIVLRDRIRRCYAIFFALRELLDVQADLLGQKLRQLLVDAMPPREIGGQFMRAVSLIDVDVLILSIANLDRDRQELLAASLALRHVSLSWLLHL